MTADDYAHVIIACLTHDIGYVRGLFKDDDEDGFVVDSRQGVVIAARCVGRQLMAPCRPVETYVMDGSGLLRSTSSALRDAIEGTRFPPPAGEECDEEASIVSAADFIGQLGDPNYLRKANALYHELKVGINRQLGYKSPADIVDRYPQFYWNPRGAANPDRDWLSQQDVERPAMDLKPLRQCVPRRTRDPAVRPAKI